MQIPLTHASHALSVRSLQFALQLHGCAHPNTHALPAPSVASTCYGSVYDGHSLITCNPNANTNHRNHICCLANCNPRTNTNTPCIRSKFREFFESSRSRFPDILLTLLVSLLCARAYALHHQIQQQRNGGFFDLELTVPSHNVPRVSFPMLTGTPLDSDPGLVALLPFLGGIFVQSGAGCYADGMNDDVMSYPGGSWTFSFSLNL